MKAPWTDFAGRDVHEGDVIEHPSGEKGQVVFILSENEPCDQWCVDYGKGELSRLCLQIGEKGRAIVIQKSISPNGFEDADDSAVSSALVWPDWVHSKGNKSLGLAALMTTPEFIRCMSNAEEHIDALRLKIIMGENVENIMAHSIAYKAGQDAKRTGIKLKDSAVRNLRPGTQQYEDFIAGYDGKKMESAILE